MVINTLDSFLDLLFRAGRTESNSLLNPLHEAGHLLRSRLDLVDYSVLSAVCFAFDGARGCAQCRTSSFCATSKFLNGLLTLFLDILFKSVLQLFKPLTKSLSSFLDLTTTSMDGESFLPFHNDLDCLLLQFSNVSGQWLTIGLDVGLTLGSLVGTPSGCTLEHVLVVVGLRGVGERSDPVGQNGGHRSVIHPREGGGTAGGGAQKSHGLVELRVGDMNRCMVLS
ncbi:hypothetical protein B0O80DRAFT_453324 [Mortierella sp. GBAus27b]|nr:hypothetical protein B0O80DRAFT_453324 [Mortierella sp. GBAus27b]